MSEKANLKRLGEGADEVPYSFWEQQMRLHFLTKGYYKVVSGSYAKPKPIKGKGEGNTEVTINQQEIDSWVNADIYGQSTIFNCLGMRETTLISKCKSSHEMWKTLADIYSTTSTLNKNQVMREFQNYKHKEGDSLVNTYLTMEAMSNQLETMGSPLPPDAVTTAIISSLPEKYKSFRQFWNMQDSANQTMTNLMAKLKYLDLEDKLEKSKNGEEDDDQNAFVAKRGRGRGNGRGGRGGTSLFLRRNEWPRGTWRRRTRWNARRSAKESRWL